MNEEINERNLTFLLSTIRGDIVWRISHILNMMTWFHTITTKKNKVLDEKEKKEKAKQVKKGIVTA